MKKIFGLVALAVTSLLIAGHNIEQGFSWELVAPVIIGFGLLLWVSFALLSWWDEQNVEGNVLYLLDRTRGYQLVGQTIIARQPVQILIELDTKKKRIALIEPDRNCGFVEVKRGEATFWIPPGKILVDGSLEDCVFTLTESKSKEPINWAH